LLANGASIDDLLGWMMANEAASWVLCTHGEVLHSLLHAAQSSGLITVPVRATD
jgi:hypothetical protein